MGIMNSTFVAAWVGAAAMRWIPSEFLEQLPVPPVATWPLISEATRTVMRASGASRPRAEKELDAVVLEAYGLTPPPLVDNDAKTDAGWQEALASEPVLTVGSVEQVRGHHVLLHVAGLTSPEGSWMPPPAAMPGWACRAGALFQVLGAETADDLSNAVYLPQEAAWLSGDVLAELGGPT
jgi:hypothetical protein